MAFIKFITERKMSCRNGRSFDSKRIKTKAAIIIEMNLKAL